MLADELLAYYLFTFLNVGTFTPKTLPSIPNARRPKGPNNSTTVSVHHALEMHEVSFCFVSEMTLSFPYLSQDHCMLGVGRDL